MIIIFNKTVEYLLLHPSSSSFDLQTYYSANLHLLGYLTF